MNIKSIEINKNCSSAMIFEEFKITLYCVKLTVRKYFWKTEIIEAFPTKICNKVNSENPLFFYYCDKYGKFLSEDDSQQINNFIILQELIKP